MLNQPIFTPPKVSPVSAHTHTHTHTHTLEKYTYIPDTHSDTHTRQCHDLSRGSVKLAMAFKMGGAAPADHLLNTHTHTLNKCV